MTKTVSIFQHDSFALNLKGLGLIVNIIFLSCLCTSVLIAQPAPEALSNSARNTQRTIQPLENVFINTQNGNVQYLHLIVAIPSSTLPIAFSLSYNSLLSNQRSSFGMGWQSSYEMYYLRESGGNIRVFLGNGGTELYTRHEGLYYAPRGVFDTFQEYRPGKYVLRKKDGTQIFFDSPIHKRVTRIKEPNGGTLEFEYNSQRLLKKISDLKGRHLSFSYDMDGLITAIEQPLNRRVEFIYDQQSANLVGITNSNGQRTTFSYDAEMLHQIEQARGLITSFVFEDNRIQKIESDTKEIALTYGGNTTIVQENGLTTQYKYDEKDRLVETQDPLGYVRTYTWDESNYLVAEQDELQRVIRYEYDTQGNIARITGGSGAIVSFTYEPEYGRLAGFTDANGQVTFISYDSQGNPIQIIYPDGTGESFTYNQDGLVVNIVDKNGNSTSYEYDINGYPAQINYPIGTETLEYDDVGNLLSRTDPEGNKTSYEYDNENRLLRLTDPLGAYIQFIYDEAGNLVRETNRLGNSTSYTYDLQNRIQSITTPIGTTQFTYDNRDNLLSMRNPNGNLISYEYDEFNRQISIIDALGHVTLFTYDAVGNLATRTDANGDKTTYTYDSSDRLVSKAYKDNIDLYKYNASGNVINAENNHIQIAFTYDEQDRIVEKKILNWEKSITYTYDSFGNRLSMTDPEGGLTTYSYDAANRLVAMQNPFGERTSFSYDARGFVTQVVHANGFYSEYAYDVGGRLVSLHHYNANNQLFDSYSYTYDANGNRITLTDEDNEVTNYTYDSFGQLLSVEGPTRTEFYAYDSWGNRLVANINGSVTNFLYDETDRMTSSSNGTFAFDNTGNLIFRNRDNASQQFRYDGLGRMSSIVFEDGSERTFHYDPLGNRVEVLFEGGELKRFFHDEPNVIAELDTTGATVARYTVGLGYDEWISAKINGLSSIYYHKDGLGSIHSLSDENGLVVQTYSYDAYGGIIENSGGISNPYTYTGRAIEEGTDMYYYRDRYYASGEGRFVQRDPLGYVSLQNDFSYVFNNPINYIDPKGQFGWGTALGFAQKQIAKKIGKKQADRFFNEAVDDGLVPNEPKPPLEPKPDLPGLRDAIDEETNPKPDPPDPPEPPEPSDDPVPPDDDGPPPSPDDNPPPNPPKPLPPAGEGKDGGVESGPMNKKASAFMGPDSRFPKALMPSQTPAFSLTDILPDVGPNGTTAISVAPRDVSIGVNNTLEALAIDFVDNERQVNLASILGVLTEGEAYTHDYAVCNRFHDYTLETVTPIYLENLTAAPDGAWFWYASTTKDTLVEEAIIFNAMVNEATGSIAIDSKWLSDNYDGAIGPDIDQVFNFQIWSSSLEESIFLLERTLEKLNDHGSLSYLNIDEPDGPTTVIKSARQEGSSIRLLMHNWLGTPQPVDFSGTYRDPKDRMTNIPLEETRVVNPGLNDLKIELADFVDATVEIEAAGFFDKVYVGGGFWFVFDDGLGGSNVELSFHDPDFTTNSDPEEFILLGEVSMSGNVSIDGFVGIGRTLNPNGLPVNVSDYDALTFLAKGNGQSYRVQVETKSIADTGSFDFYQFVITPPTEWTAYTIPYEQFSRIQSSNEVSVFNGEDVVSVVWIPIGTPIENVDLSLNRVGFISSVLISETTPSWDTSDTNGPYSISTRIAEEQEPEVSLYFRTRGSEAFEMLALERDGALFTGEIPGHPLATEIEYYVRATDAFGNIATDPVDVPAKSYRLQVTGAPWLWIDEFSDTDSANDLGYHSDVFASGGTINQKHNSGILELNYDLSEQGSFAGYFTSLDGMDLSPFQYFSFLVKDDNTPLSFLVGLKKTDGSEIKINPQEYIVPLDDGWQRIEIPLQLLPDRTSIENVSFIFEDETIDSGVVLLDDLRFLSAPFTSVSKERPEVILPADWVLDQNYPNPFDTSTTIRYGLPENSPVRISLFDLLGREVAIIEDLTMQQAGYHSLQFEAGSLSSGVYFCVMQVDEKKLTKRMVLVRS